MRKHFAHPIISDLSCLDGNPFSPSVFKRELVLGLSFEFASPFRRGLNERIFLKTSWGEVNLASRDLDGPSGFIDFSNHPIPAGKAKICLRAQTSDLRCTRTIIWVSGDRVPQESIF